MTKILGIDPGSRITGYGLIQDLGRQGFRYIDSGCIRTGELELSQRLLLIFNGICELLEQYQPEQVAIEQIFMHQNPNAALKLGHARGVAMVACASHRLKLHEYSAREVKQAVVGFGAAEKAQVQHMVVQLLQLDKSPQADAADALAIAICHSHRQKGLVSGIKTTKKTRWTDDWLAERTNSR